MYDPITRPVERSWQGIDLACHCTHQATSHHPGIPTLRLALYIAIAQRRKGRERQGLFHLPRW